MQDGVSVSPLIFLREQFEKYSTSLLVMFAAMSVVAPSIVFNILAYSVVLILKFILNVLGVAVGVGFGCGLVRKTHLEIFCSHLHIET